MATYIYKHREVLVLMKLTWLCQNYGIKDQRSTKWLPKKQNLQFNKATVCQSRAVPEAWLPIGGLVNWVICNDIPGRVEEWHIPSV